jgi:hypothetical protein
MAAGRRLKTHQLNACEINEPGGVLGIKFQNLMQMTGATFLNEFSVQSARIRSFYEQIMFLSACSCILTFIGQTGSPCQVKCNALWNKGKTLSTLI